MKKLLLLVLIANCQLTIDNCQAQTLIRGPYLQSPGQTSIILRWRTDTASNSRVSYGTSYGSTEFTTDETTDTTEHRVKLTGLLPHTQYYYIIGSTTQSLRGPDPIMHFTTAPDTTIPTPVRFWAIGDFGHGDAGQILVRESYVAYAAATKPADLWLWLGDNVYYDGLDSEYTLKVFDSIYGYHHLFMNLPFAATPGNHDYVSIAPLFYNTNPYTHTGAYLDIIDPPILGELGGVPSNLKLFYSFDYGDIHFVSLNSELGTATAAHNWTGIFNNDTAFTSPMIAWLKADMAATTKKWKIAFWHQMPYSLDGFTDVQPFQFAMRQHFNRILEKYGVDLVLAGHDHNYQRTYLINGHYKADNTLTPEMILDNGSGNEALGEAYIKASTGPDKNKGTVYAIVGNSGTNTNIDIVPYPVIYTYQICDTCIGSLIVDIDGDRLTGRYLAAAGDIRDEFTIIKGESAGIEDVGITNHNELTVYPNPGKQSITVTIGKDIQLTNAEFGLYDMSGKNVLQITDVRERTFNVTVSHLSEATYTYRLTTQGKSVATGKVIVQ